MLTFQEKCITMPLNTCIIAQEINNWAKKTKEELNIEEPCNYIVDKIKECIKNQLQEPIRKAARAARVSAIATRTSGPNDELEA